MIGKLPDTLEDRSISIQMARKKPGEKVARLRLDRLPFEPLRRQAARWGTDVRNALFQSDPEVPEELNDRAADNWRPLLAIADAAGGDWPAIARKAALEAAAASKGEDSSAGVQLLGDLQSIFECRGAGRLLSSDLVAELTEMEDRPWPEWKSYQPLTMRQLAKLLKPFGVKPRQIRVGAKTAKGYMLEDLSDAFERYLPSPERNNRNSPLESTTYVVPLSETQRGGVSDPKPPETLDFMRVVSDVSDREEGSGESTEENPREVVTL